MEKVQIYYQEIAAAANHVDEQYQVLHEVRQGCGEAFDNLHGRWVSPAASRFFASTQALLKRSADLAEGIGALVDTLDTIVKVLREVEEDARAQFDWLADEGTPVSDLGASAGSVAAGAIGGSGQSPQAPPQTVPASGRSGEDLNRVIDSFNVAHNPEYAPRGGNTYCNIFAMDTVNKLVGQHALPEFLTNPQGQVVDWLDANEMVRWLEGDYQRAGYHGPVGPEVGWRQLSPQEAVQYANQGHPVVVGWENPGGIGHMAVLRAGNDPNADVHSLRIAQAGARNFSDGTIEQGFGKGKALKFFAYAP